MDNWNLVEIQGQAIIPFEWIDRVPGKDSLGKAEFIVCPKFKRGRVSEFWVYPAQQRNMKDAWHFTGGDISFAISSCDGLGDANAWLFFQCKEHKTTSIRLYSPNDSRYLIIDRHGLTFKKTSVW